MTMPDGQGCQRIEPALPPAAMKSYRISMPPATHWRPATCAEVECDHYMHGWRTVVPADSPAAEYIRHDKTRRHTEKRQHGGLAVFEFEPGQRGFAPAHEHRVRTGRPERFLELGGDWRGNPLGTPARVHVRPDDWVDSFAGNLDSIRTAHERG